MLFLTSKSRLPLAILLLLSFFIPASNNISAFNLIAIAFSEAKSQADITAVDVFVGIAPLVSIPILAIVISVRSAMQLSIRKTVLLLPLVLLIFFFTLLSFTLNSSRIHLSGSKLLSNMQIGFYLAVVASLLLVFTKNWRRHRRKRRKRSATKEVEVAVEKEVQPLLGL
ncbi:MAG TPA: hypothetical protein VEY10_05895 [Flavisolibacter sp.]|jgi:ABC-type transport system involved in cytochrome c biogenesis permease component|nr:hypothetical protein [Flavisolibacter sp.]